MSLKRFAELFLDLDASNSKNKKIEILQDYFAANDPL